MTTNNKRLLFVDDDPTIRKSLSIVFTFKKIPHTIASSGEEALDLLARETFDLVVSDIGIPGMNGIELGKRIREKYPDLPRVAFTGSAVGEKAVEEVYDTVFEKPIDLDKMVAEIQRVLLIKDE